MLLGHDLHVVLPLLYLNMNEVSGLLMSFSKKGDKAITYFISFLYVYGN